MKRILKGTLILACTSLLMTGCAKDEQIQGLQGIGDQTVTFSVGLENAATKAAVDQDGKADSVNRWIMEVRDSDGGLFNRQVQNGTIGEKEKSFSVRLVKGQTYNVLFWADYDGGYYDVSDLTNVKLTNPSTYTANLDSRDAFTAVEKGFSITESTKAGITLKRPFGQLNVVFTDLDTLYKTIGNADEYAKFKPKNFQVLANVPTSFNVYSQTAGDQASVIIKADKDYKDNYDTHSSPATLFMDYLFASNTTKDIVDINFRFDSKDGVTIEHNFTAIPFQRNYRTNINGDLMTTGATWTVTVDPTWNSPDFDVPFMETSSISEAQSYIAPATSGTQEAKVIKISEGAVTTGDVKQEKVEGLNVVEFVLKQNSPKEVSFVLPAVGDNADAWYVTYDGTYPTENVAIDAPAGTKVIVNAPTSHVKVTGTNYATIIASTDDNTLEIPAGCTVDNLVVKEGGLEIHGTVNSVEIQQTKGKNIYVRACEGLSESVYTVLEKYIANGYEAVKLETTPVTYNIVLTSVNWADYAAKSFSQIDESAKTINILSEAEFALFANKVNAGTTYEGWTITLGNALDMSGHKWTPIGNLTDNINFKGIFDGKGLSISGLDIYSKDKKGVGVFGQVYAPCVLKNIKVINAVVTAEGTNTYTGGLVGHGYATIENCSFQGTVNGGNQMGGIAASGGFTIRNCTFDGTINGKYWGLGGIIGNCQDGGEISGNTAKGNIVGVLADCTDPFNGGGIIGCAIYTNYNVKNNYSGMQISYNGKPQTDFPIVGVYNIDAPSSDIKIDFSNLLTTLGDNTWDKSIFTGDEYEIYYNTDAPVSAGYMLNYGAATTQIEVAKIGDTIYSSLNAALAAVKDGETIILGENITDTPTSVGAIANVNGKTFTIRGVDQASSIVKIGDGQKKGSDGYCDYRFEGANVTFDNLTFSQTYHEENSWLNGLVRVGKLTFTDCIMEGTAAYWGNDCTFDGCIFDRSDIYEYSIYTWGCADMTVKKSIFNTQGKAVKMYGAGTCTLNVEGCTFNSNGKHSGADKPAIAINTGDYTTDYTVNITDCTQTGFVAGATGSAMFGSDKLAEVQGNLDVYVDGVQVWKDGASVE